MIKNRTKFVLIAGIGLSLFSGLSQAMFLKKGAYDTALVITNPSAPARLGSLALIHDDEGFSVLNKSEIRRIPNHLVDKDLRGISQDEVKARLDDNIAFRVQQGSDGEFSLQEGGGLKGGVGDDVGKKFGVEAAKELRTLGDHALLVGGSLAGIYMASHVIPKIYSFIQPTTEVKNKEIEAKCEHTVKQLKLNLSTCLSEKNIEGTVGIPFEGTVGIPSACIKQFNQWRIAVDAMKVGEDTAKN
jgi:hypothetical protein